VQRAAPLLAPLVEEGLVDGELARLAVRHYLRELAGCDTIVLGCTHYPLLADVVRDEAAALPGAPRVLDPSETVAERLADWLARHPAFDDATDRPGAGRLRVLCTGDAASFLVHGARFLGEPIPEVEHVTAVGGRLEPRDPAHAPTGQFVR
jgi:glutamate racemase